MTALSAGATSALLVVLARDHLDLDPSGYGLCSAQSGSGPSSDRSCSPDWSATHAPAPVRSDSVLQAHIPEHARGRGRIFASFDVLWQLGRLISLLLGGLLTAWLGIQSVYYLGGGLLLLAAGLGWCGLRSASPTSNLA